MLKGMASKVDGSQILARQQLLCFYNVLETPPSPSLDRSAIPSELQFFALRFCLAIGTGHNIVDKLLVFDVVYSVYAF